MKKIKSVEQLEQIKFEQIDSILQILGLIETKGVFFQKDPSKITHQTIEEILDILGAPIEKDNSRQINNARDIFNRLSKEHIITGGRSGTNFKNRRTGAIADRDIKGDNAYQTLVVIYLSLLFYQGTIHLDFLSQLLEVEHPIDFLTTLEYAIKNKVSISFQYKSDRQRKILKVDPFVPVKIYFKDNHWLVVGWDERQKNWIQYLIHSIKNIKQSRILIDTKALPLFDFGAFRKKSFGLAVLHHSTSYRIEIEVPSSFYDLVRKRRKEGVWNKKTEPYIWTVDTYDKHEVFDYIFRWNGKLKIAAPLEIKQEFQNKLRSFLES